MSEKNITSEYRGLLSEKKPFDVINPNLFQIYLDENLIKTNYAEATSSRFLFL